MGHVRPCRGVAMAPLTGGPLPVETLRVLKLATECHDRIRIRRRNGWDYWEAAREEVFRSRHVWKVMGHDSKTIRAAVRFVIIMGHAVRNA